MRRLFHSGLRGALLGAVLGGVVLAGGLAACGTNRTGSIELAADSSPEVQALAGIGVDPAYLPVSDPSPSPSASAGPGAGGHGGGLRHRIRVALRKKTLHAEATVQTKNGVETLAAQRGTVTAVTATTVTVKSTDGFTQTWTFGSPVRVVRDKKPTQPSAVTTGAEIAVAGPKTGGTYTARLVVLT